MAYQALYRKYRPTDFSQLVGQEVVKKTLQNSLKNGKISHAYLFSGPRGTGKTTIAKIFAKTVNCLSIKDGNPCLKCDNCLAISNNECPDIIEIDAASNNGVDEIRELRNKVSLVPSELKYKVYIIDEVHMLSIGAFNALLKTLEEPPEHVIFILATTDPQKVPITIISRCQCFNFKRISENDIVSRLKEISKLEKFSIDDDVLKEIARYSDGGMRDALGLLDKLVSYSSDKITINDFREINGLLSESDISLFLQKIYESDNNYVLNKLDEYYLNGKDLIRFAEDLILYIRNLLVKKYISHEETLDVHFLNSFALELNQLLSLMKESSNIKVLFEIKLLQFMNNSDLSSSPIEKNASNDKQMFDDKKSVSKSSVNKTTNQESISNSSNEEKMDVSLEDTDTNKNLVDAKNFRQIRINNALALADKKELIWLKEQWKKIMDFTLDREIGATSCFLTDATPVVASPKNVILAFEYSSLVEHGNEILDKIEFAFTKIFDKSYRVVLLTNEEWKEEKKKYIENKNKNITYQYQEEDNFVQPEKEDASSDMSDLTKTAIQLFGKNIVKIDE